MDIKPTRKNIKELFLSGRKFVIPRFQREYCWDKKISRIFFSDILKQLVVENNKVISQSYFLGTMLFIGDYYDGSDDEVFVVDGQQRLTTITILFSAMSNKFIELNEETLSKEIFKYIMTTDDNGEEVRVLRSKTHYPYFAYFIQDRKKENKQDPNTEEEKNIFEIYNMFSNLLKEQNIKKALKKIYGSNTIDNLKYLDLLKAIRDQILKCMFVSISTTDKGCANEIFEILNSKGKQLQSIDIIKNDICKILDKEEPVDIAEDKWNKIKEILNSKNEHVGMEVFFRHFWTSKYKKVSKKNIVQEFKKKIKTEEDCISLLDDLIHDAKNYIKILNPERRDFDNRQEYFFIVQSLKYISEYFNIVQTRIILLALLDLKERDLIDLKILKKTMNYIEMFHYVYNSVCSYSANKLERIYSTFSINVRKSNSKEEVKNIIEDQLIEPLKNLIPMYEDFEAKFIDLTYSNKEDVSNIKTKYALYKINSLYEKEETFTDNCSIEHILSEGSVEFSTNIGNLIVLETKLNGKASDLMYSDKKSVYEKSKLNWVSKFIEDYSEWNESMINNRAKEMAKILYNSLEIKI